MATTLYEIDEIPQDEATFDTLGTSTHLIVVTE